MAPPVIKNKRSPSTLAREIGLVLIIKVILLWLLWHFFFSEPEGKHMRLPEQQVTQHLLSNTSSNPPRASTQHDR